MNEFSTSSSPSSRFRVRLARLIIGFQLISPSFAGIEPPQPLDGHPFLEGALAGKRGLRDHVTVGWGSTVTVIDERWWLNVKIDGTGAFLYDLKAPAPREKNVADENQAVVQRLFRLAVDDARGGFPDYLMELARTQTDAPGCSELATRPT